MSEIDFESRKSLSNIQSSIAITVNDRQTPSHDMSFLDILVNLRCSKEKQSI